MGFFRAFWLAEHFAVGFAGRGGLRTASPRRFGRVWSALGVGSGPVSRAFPAPGRAPSPDGCAPPAWAPLRTAPPGPWTEPFAPRPTPAPRKRPPAVREPLVAKTNSRRADAQGPADVRHIPRKTAAFASASPCGGGNRMMPAATPSHKPRPAPSKTETERHAAHTPSSQSGVKNISGCPQALMGNGFQNSASVSNPRQGFSGWCLALYSWRFELHRGLARLGDCVSGLPQHDLSGLRLGSNAAQRFADV